MLQGLSMQWFTWTLFIMSEIFMAVVLLNFLIAVIGNSYEEVMRRIQIITYQHMTHFIDEASLF